MRRHIAQGMQLRAVNRAEIERSMAVIDLDLGRYAEARDRLLTMIARTTADGERSLLYRLLATVYIELGDATEALKNAAAALESIPADDPWGMKPYAQQAKARALALAGRNEEALAEIDTVIGRFLRVAARPTLSKCNARNGTARNSWRRRAAMPKR